MNLQSRSTFITIYWVASGGQITENRDIGLTARPWRIKYFLIKHIVFIGDECYGHWFANVEWFYPVTDDLKDKFGKPTELCHNSLFEQFGAAPFIPVFRILSKFTFALFEYRSETLMVIIPRINFPSFNSNLPGEYEEELE